MSGLFEYDENDPPPDTRSDMQRMLGMPSDAEKAAQSAKFQQKLFAIFTGADELEDNSGPYKLRLIVEADQLFVPVTTDGAFQTVTAGPGEHDRLFCVASKKDGKRTDRVGKGGKLLPVFFSRPQGEVKTFDGRSFARELKHDYNGILVHSLGDDKPFELSSDFFDSLRSIAKAVEVEDELTADGSMDATRLRKAKFRVVTYKDNVSLGCGSVPFGATAAAFTQEDLDFITDDELKIKVMPGEQLFQTALDLDECEGLFINPFHEVGRGAAEIRNLLLSPGFLHRVLNNDRVYQRFVEPIARSREEVELWLQVNDFPRTYEIAEAVDTTGNTTLKAISTEATSTWRLQESYGDQRNSRLVASPVFTLRAAPDSNPGFGKGPSLILCPGLLARKLYVRPEGNKKSLHNWRPGNSFLVGRMLSDEDVRVANQRVSIATELLKLLPPGGNKIERSAMLTTVGTQFFRNVPHCATREWIEGEIAHSKRYTNKLVWG